MSVYITSGALWALGLMATPVYLYIVFRLLTAAVCKSYHESKQKKEKGE